MKWRLTKAGRNVDKCQICGACSKTPHYKYDFWYIGFTRRRLDRVMILCSDCYDRMDDEEK